jgi:hypothetical protein
LTKEYYIKYWKTTAAKDWKAVQDMFKAKNFVHALFWSHLVLEKLCKTHWHGMHLTELEKEKIIAFLNTLTDSAFITNPEFSNPFLKEMK